MCEGFRAHTGLKKNPVADCDVSLLFPTPPHTYSDADNAGNWNSAEQGTKAKMLLVYFVPI